MTAYETISLVNNALDTLSKFSTSPKPNTSDIHVVNKWTSIYKILKIIEHLPFVGDDVKKVLASSAYIDSLTDSFSISKTDLATLKSNLTILTKTLTTIKETVKYIMPCILQDNPCVIVRIPSDSPLKNVSEVIDTLDHVLNKEMVMHKYNGGHECEIVCVENGSLVIWLSIGTGLIILGMICDFAFQVAQNYNMLKAQKYVLRAMNQNEELIENLNKVNKLYISKMCNDYAKDISNNIVKDAEDVKMTDEEINSLGKSIERMSTLFTRGVSIQTSMLADAKVQKLFPSNENIKSLAKQAEQKLLSEENVTK